ncbi:MAG: hypothetical protein M3151_06260 [Actinomycetota bacterium]|nr:hypothetical protein [Actinomycetota bacterium]
MCGPTASGKSELSDTLAERETELSGGRDVPTIAVDSMQVYRELPIITNQARRRPAELVGVVSVTERWTVARHREWAERIVEDLVAGARFVLDAGTGMYLNAILLDIPLSPKVPPDLRRYAQEAAQGQTNPRRAARTKELEMMGAPERGSIWEGSPRYDTTIIYLRPDRSALDAAIAKRSAKIAHEGHQEARLLHETLVAGVTINPSVLDSVGVRELTLHLAGDLPIREAQDRINARTRQLARRQMRWFDKLARTLEGRARIQVLTGPEDAKRIHSMHGII